MMLPPPPQLVIAIPFLVLGSWCLIFPGHVEALVLTSAYQHSSVTSHLLFGCFGAQAVIGGLFAMFSSFRRATYIAYAIALLPFFVFNYYFVVVMPVLNSWMLLDFGANIVMLVACIWGIRTTRSATNGLSAP